MKTITFSLELTESEAFAIAQFFKRATFSDYRQRAIDDDEAYEMIAASGKLREILAEKGVEAPPS